MIVPGGGLSLDGARWIACRPGFFLHVRVLSRLFRRLFLEGLTALHRAGELAFFSGLEPLAQADAFADWLAPLRKSEWVVIVPEARLRHDAKPPFGGPKAVLAYISRYTHRVAISNRRLISADAGTVAFRWKDYRIKRGDRQKVMRLATPEFIRRFLIHFLPPLGGFGSAKSPAGQWTAFIASGTTAFSPQRSARPISPGAVPCSGQ
ncbi:Putative transposase [Leisingera aquaemixtae]|uniref:Putative transposase n=1 Tax=Leisingera aquaemixtae TaxID=1396826 RepID=A0A0P1HA10_9RHOB|nr:Putative transposase [Leisingera aquaemixtae]